MKTLAKFRISNALDRGKALPASLARQVAASDELGRFAEGCAGLGRALKESAPPPAAPAWLHGSIMGAVRAAARPAPGLAALRWAPAAGLGLALALASAVVVWTRSHSVKPPPGAPMAITQALGAPGTALELGGRVTRAVPSGMVAPLSDELERLNRDLDQTAQFLLANLP